MKRISETAYIAVCPDILVEAHAQANISLYKWLRGEADQLTIFACPSFICIQNAIAEDFCFSHSAPELYRITKEIDTGARRSLMARSLGSTCNHAYLTDIISLDDYLDIGSRVSSTNTEDLESLSHCGCSVGLAAAIDLSLTLKATYSHIKDKRAEEFARLTVFHNIIAIEAISRIICFTKETTHTTQVIHNSVYSQNLSIYSYLEGIKIPQFFVEASALFRNKVKVYKNQIEDQVIRRILMASQFDHGTPESYFWHARQYLDRRIGKGASHTYSPTTGKFLLQRIEDVYPECANKKRFVYYTNSPDELTSITASMQLLGMAETLPHSQIPFKSEYENIAALVCYARMRQDEFFFIRMHPRLGKDKRGLDQSYCRDEYISQILSMEPPENVHIIYPEDKTPSYWLGCWTHGVLSFRGTMPLEMNLFGYKPLIGSAELGIINSAINIHAIDSRKSTQEWQSNLQTLYSSTSAKQLREFIREFWYSREYGYIDLECIKQNRKEQERLTRSLLGRNSLEYLPYKLRSRKQHGVSQTIRYLLWLSQFTFEHITTHEDAPVYSIIDSLLRECHLELSS